MTISLTDIIKDRRTIHHFESTPVPQAIVQEALSLAVYAPNHHHTHPCHFYWFGEETKQEFLRYAEKAFSHRDPESAQKKLAKWKTIPGWILMTRKLSDDAKTAHEDYATLSISLYIMMQYLTSHGIGTKWSTGSLLFEEEVYHICNIDPKKEVIEGMFWYGYPEKVPHPFPKPEYSQFVTDLP